MRIKNNALLSFWIYEALSFQKTQKFWLLVAIARSYVRFQDTLSLLDVLIWQPCQSFSCSEVAAWIIFFTPIFTFLSPVADLILNHFVFLLPVADLILNRFVHQNLHSSWYLINYVCANCNEKSAGLSINNFYIGIVTRVSDCQRSCQFCCPFQLQTCLFLSQVRDGHNKCS